MNLEGLKIDSKAFVHKILACYTRHVSRYFLVAILYIQLSNIDNNGE